MPYIKLDLTNPIDKKRYNAMVKSGLYAFEKVPESAATYRGFIIVPFTN